MTYFNCIRWFSLLSLVGISMTLIGCASKATSVTKSDPTAVSVPGKIVCHFKDSGPKPSWINSVPRDAQYIYGVGIAPVQQQEYHQLLVSEMSAKESILKNIKVSIEAQLRDEYKCTDDACESIIASKITEHVQAVMYDVQVVDRWKDGESCLIYTLSRIKHP